MTKKKTRVDEIIILGPRRPDGRYPRDVRETLDAGNTLSPTQEATIREEVARFVISEDSDFEAPAFVRQGLAVGGWMQVRKQVEYADYDYRDIEAAEVTPEVDEDPAVQAAVEAVAEDEPQEEPEERPRPSRRRSRSGE